MKKTLIPIIIGILALLAAAVYALTHAEQLIAQAGPWVYIVYVLLIITEVVLAPIPGGIIGFLGAAQFGFLTGWLLNYTGNIIGAQIAFGLARRFGRPFVDKLVDKNTQIRYSKYATGHPFIVYLIYAIPFLPIDILSLLLGISHMKYRRFSLITIAGLASYTAIIATLGSTFGTHVPYIEHIGLAATILFVGAVAWWFYKEQGRHGPDLN